MHHFVKIIHNGSAPFENDGRPYLQLIYELQLEAH